MQKKSQGEHLHRAEKSMNNAKYNHKYLQMLVKNTIMCYLSYSILLI